MAILAGAVIVFASVSLPPLLFRKQKCALRSLRCMFLLLGLLSLCICATCFDALNSTNPGGEPSNTTAAEGTTMLITSTTSATMAPSNDSGNGSRNNGQDRMARAAPGNDSTTPLANGTTLGGNGNGTAADEITTTIDWWGNMAVTQPAQFQKDTANAADDDDTTAANNSNGTMQRADGSVANDSTSSVPSSNGTAANSSSASPPTANGTVSSGNGTSTTASQKNGAGRVHYLLGWMAMAALASALLGRCC